MNSNSISPLLLLLLSLSSFFIPQASSSLCRPRSDPYDVLFNNFLKPSSPSNSSTPSPPPSSPSPRPLAMSPLPQSPVMTPQHAPVSPDSAPAPSTSLDTAVKNAFKSFRSSGVLNDAVKAICDKTDHPNVCMDSIQSASKDLSKISTDALSILKIVIDSAVNHTNNAMQKAKNIANSPKTSSSTKKLIAACTQGYEDALEDLSDAIKALEKNDKGAWSSDLSALFSDYENCSDAFEEAQMDSPMKADEDLLTQIASNCLAIGNSI